MVSLICINSSTFKSVAFEVPTEPVLPIYVVLSLSVTRVAESACSLSMVSLLVGVGKDARLGVNTRLLYRTAFGRIWSLMSRYLQPLFLKGLRDSCQVQENYGGNSGNSRCQVQTYEMSEGTSASAYVLCPFQTLVPRFQNGKTGDQRSEDWSKDWSCSQSRT